MIILTMNNMKRFLTVFILSLFCCISFAQNRISFTATFLAVAEINQYSGRYSWSNWQRCDVTIIMDLQNDVIYIYSQSPQRYTVITDGVTSYDNGGGKQVSYKVVDQDGDRGTLRLRQESNGNSQIYVDFADVAWVYNVIRN